MASVRARPRWVGVVLAVLTLFLLLELAIHAGGTAHDVAAALGYRYELDYGEGIVWQQAVLMFTPRMYSPAPGLPFVVFHYPPLFHFAVRALMAADLDPLFAGRLVSVTSTLTSATVIALLTVASLRGRVGARQIVLAIVSGLIFLCLGPVREFGLWMRVDMLAIALGLIGTYVAVMTRCSGLGTTVALLLCVAAVFAKQTMLPAGISVFAVAVLFAPRHAVVAALIAGLVGVAGLVVLELSTHGFLHNIIGSNINPMEWYAGLNVLRFERLDLPFMFVMVFAAIMAIYRLPGSHLLRLLRERDRVAMARSMLFVHFVIACCFAGAILKVGSWTNYFLDFMSAGSPLIGVVLGDLLVQPVLFGALTLVLALATSRLDIVRLPPARLAANAADSERLVSLIREQSKPVASDDMVLLMRAGKGVFYEPAIVDVLVTAGAWDPAPLLSAFEHHELAFVLTDPDDLRAGPVIKAAIEQAYPRIVAGSRRLQMHLPAQSAP